MRGSSVTSSTTVAYPRRAFAFFDAIAAATSALYSGLIGFIGGVAFEDDRIRDLLLGLGIAVTITVSVEARIAGVATASCPAQRWVPMRTPVSPLAFDAEERPDAPVLTYWRSQADSQAATAELTNGLVGSPARSL